MFIPWLHIDIRLLRPLRKNSIRIRSTPPIEYGQRSMVPVNV
jgi:hypothetical protein